MVFANVFYEKSLFEMLQRLHYKGCLLTQSS